MSDLKGHIEWAYASYQKLNTTAEKLVLTFFASYFDDEITISQTKLTATLCLNNKTIKKTIKSLINKHLIYIKNQGNGKTSTTYALNIKGFHSVPPLTIKGDHSLPPLKNGFIPKGGQLVPPLEDKKVPINTNSYSYINSINNTVTEVTEEYKKTFEILNQVGLKNKKLNPKTKQIEEVIFPENTFFDLPQQLSLEKYLKENNYSPEHSQQVAQDMLEGLIGEIINKTPKLTYTDSNGKKKGYYVSLSQTYRNWLKRSGNNQAIKMDSASPDKYAKDKEKFSKKVG
jgi:hypothetical protein